MSRTLTVKEYCRALETWAELALKKNIIDDEAYRKVRQGITKSCLLDRLIYGGEQLRTRKCPIHNGRWSGVKFEKCPAGCDRGHCGCLTGWLHNDLKVLEGWGWTFWLANALGETLPTMMPARLYLAKTL